MRPLIEEKKTEKTFVRTNNDFSQVRFHQASDWFNYLSAITLDRQPD